MADRAAIILAAGKGTRMRSATPKPLHEVGGRAMLDWSVELARAAGCRRIVVVVGPDQPELSAHVEAALGPDAVAVQDRPLGTGHAVRAAEAAFEDFEGRLIVLYADTPLVPPGPVERLFAEVEGGAALGVLGFEAAAPGGYGRLILGADGALERIVEAKDATPNELAVTLCNSGVMAGNARDMFALLAKVTNENAKGEYYLTDLVGLARQARGVAKIARCAEADVMGVNSRVELAACEAAFQARRRVQVMEAGATLAAPETVFLSHDTEIGADTLVEPNVVFGPGVKIASGVVVKAFSHLEGCEIETGAVVGPYARLRPGARIGPGARVGNFVEIKNTRLGAGAKANHLSYVGDGEVGAGANLGAGVIFCNYDGFEKRRTLVGENAFVGSNSALVAPVSVGDGAYVGSGSVITRDVPADALALARGRQEEKLGWAEKYRVMRRAETDKKT